MVESSQSQCLCRESNSDNPPEDLLDQNRELTGGGGETELRVWDIEIITIGPTLKPEEYQSHRLCQCAVLTCG